MDADKLQKIKELNDCEVRQFSQNFRNPTITEVSVGSLVPRFITNSSEYNGKARSVSFTSGAATSLTGGMEIKVIRRDENEGKRGGYPYNMDLYVISGEPRTLFKLKPPFKGHKRDFPSHIGSELNKQNTSH